MDPALWELLRRRAGDAEVEAIVRLADPSLELPGVRIVSRFGTVATCRIPADQVVDIRSRPDVYSVKAPRAIGPALLEATTQARRLRATERRRPPGLGVTGAGTIVASVDWGVDVAAACFRRPVAQDGVTVPGGTRLLALWDQRDQHDRPVPATVRLRVVHSRAEIDRALQTDDPYAELGYHPSIADGGSGTHGAHVLDIAAGNGLAGGPVGIAPRQTWFRPPRRSRHGWSVQPGRLAAAARGGRLHQTLAAGRPWVVNLSVGRTGGPHDASTLVELGFEGCSQPSRLPDRAQRRQLSPRAHPHERRPAPPAVRPSFTFVVVPGRPHTERARDLGTGASTSSSCASTRPGSAGGPALELGQRAELTVGDRLVGRVYHRRCDPNNGDNLIDAFLDPHGLAGLWTVTLEGRRVVDGRSTPGSSVTTRAASASRASSVATPSRPPRRAPSPTAIAAGGRCLRRTRPTLAARAVQQLGPDSGRTLQAGPVRARRDVLAVRSSPAGATEHDGALVRKSGTSMAAPHVTGAVALCLQMLGPTASPQVIRDLVLGTCIPTWNQPCDRFGHGYLDVAALVAASRSLVARRTS